MQPEMTMRMETSWMTLDFTGQSFNTTLRNQKFDFTVTVFDNAQLDILEGHGTKFTVCALINLTSSRSNYWIDSCNRFDFK